jgi:hypothetical protein
MAANHSTDIVINEVLFVVRNYYGRTPRSTISSVLSGFYTDDEISEAKTILLSFAELIDPKIDDLKNIKPRCGGTKRKREAEDIIQIYSLLDAKKVSLPMYVAFNVLRIPSFRPEDVDVCAMASNINNLTTQITDIRGIVDNFGVLQKQVAEIAESLGELKSRGSSDTSAAVMQPNQHLASATGNLSWSEIVNKQPASHQLAVNHASGSLRSADRSTQRPIRRAAVGTGKPAKLTASNEDRFWHVFVGKLNQETSEKDVTDHLEASGIRVHKVSLMKPTKDWQRNSAAFRISVAFENKDAVFDPDLWPVNVTIRDWYFKKSNDSNLNLSEH